MLDPRMVINPDVFFANAVQQSESLEELATVLSKMLDSDLAVWEDGTLYSIRARVVSHRGLAFHVFPNDHDPPHFHVVSPNVNAKFSIESCEYLGGQAGGRDIGLIKWVFNHGGREKLLVKWRATRPTRDAS